MEGSSNKSPSWLTHEENLLSTAGTGSQAAKASLPQAAPAGALSEPPAKKPSSKRAVPADGSCAAKANPNKHARTDELHGCHNQVNCPSIVEYKCCSVDMTTDQADFNATRCRVCHEKFHAWSRGKAGHFANSSDIATHCLFASCQCSCGKHTAFFARWIKRVVATGHVAYLTVHTDSP